MKFILSTDKVTFLHKHFLQVLAKLNSSQGIDIGSMEVLCLLV
jgi:hypothetical protein